MTNKIKNRILDIEYSEKKVFWFLIFFMVIFLGFYIYFVNGAIINIVERQKIEKDIASINSRIGDLESSYINLNKKISLEYAFSAGFVKVGKEKYVYRKILGANLSINH